MRSRGDSVELINSYLEAEGNAVRFLDVVAHPTSHTYAMLGRYFHWYYFPSLDAFAPSKFIGYKNTDVQGYRGKGTGTATTRVLHKWFRKEDKTAPSYRQLEVQLHRFLKDLGAELSTKTIDGTGGIYVPSAEHVVTKFPDEVPEEEYREGIVKSVLVNAYERNPKARAACIAYYGCKCYVCNISFEQRYGEIGDGFIHVHHLQEISSIGSEYVIDPIADLRPLCPNCHAMVHTQKPAISPDALRKRLRRA